MATNYVPSDNQAMLAANLTDILQAALTLNGITADEQYYQAGPEYELHTTPEDVDNNNIHHLPESPAKRARIDADPLHDTPGQAEEGMENKQEERVTMVTLANCSESRLKELVEQKEGTGSEQEAKMTMKTLANCSESRLKELVEQKEDDIEGDNENAGGTKEHEGAVNGDNSAEESSEEEEDDYSEKEDEDSEEENSDVESEDESDDEEKKDIDAEEKDEDENAMKKMTSSSASPLLQHLMQCRLLNDSHMLLEGPCCENYCMFSWEIKPCDI